jgi:uncharacterized alpha-E superfamily protein
MYRQHVRSRINGDDVLNFLLLNTSLPRSVGCCVVEISDSINRLPNHDSLPERVVELQSYVQSIDIQQVTQLQLRGILDDLQNKLGALHGQISDNWFLTVANE